MTLRCLLSIFLFALPGLCLAQNEEEALPTLEEMVLPSAGDLLTKPARDWIVLNTGGVLAVESVSPRPNTLALRLELLEAKEEERRKLPLDQRDAITAEILQLGDFYVLMPDLPGSPEYKFPLRRIVQIIHHEDLILRRMNLLLDEGDINTALELLTRLRKTYPDWPGLEEAYHRLLFVDASQRVAKGDAAGSLMLLDDLLTLDPTRGGLKELAGQAIEILTEAAINREDYLAAQFYLNWLQKRIPDDPIFTRFTGQLRERVLELIALADQASQAGDFKQATIKMEEAVKIWSRTPELRAPHRIHTQRFQRLRVGVVDRPGETEAYFARSAADDRQAQLTSMNLFEIDRLRDGTAYYRTRFFDEWEPSDLGREMHFKLKQYRQPSEMQAIVSVTDIVTLLGKRLDPLDPEYDERFATYVESIQVQSPLEFSLKFRRVPARIEPLLAQIPVRPVDETEAIGPVTDPGGFTLVDSTAEEITYARKLPEPDGLPKYHVAEVVEQRYENFEKAAQGLQRGEVSLLPDVPDWIIRRMQADEQFMKEYFVNQYLVPETHLLQFNPASVALRSRELRTALAYAVDRPKLLKEVVLRDAKMAHGRVVTTPFYSGSPGRNIQIQPRRYDLSAAFAMLLASRKQLSTGIPPLNMIVSPDPVARDAAQEIVTVWTKLGLQVTLIQADDPAPQSWDIIYRTVRMAEPLVEIWPFLAIQDRAQLSDLDHFPDWLKQELVQLDRTSDQSRAITAMQTLHRHLSRDTSVFPLWEIDKFMVIRKNIQGFPERPVHAYDRIDQWTVDPWFQTDLP